MEEERTVDLPRKRVVDFDTSELVDELSTRKEVETSILAPCLDASFAVSGPAKVLVVFRAERAFDERTKTRMHA